MSQPLTSQDVMKWLRRLLACNPFYLVSAAVFLFGLYRLSVDPNLFRETSQLIFNLTSLQAYELLLIGTALFLGRRGIRYDSTLLVVLEAFFATVPFILISQAGLIDEHLVWDLSLMAAALAVLRFGALRYWLPQLPLIPRLAAGGLVVLVINAALPIVFRIGQETKKGIHIDEGTSYIANQVCWLAVLPIIFALINLLPRLREGGKLASPGRWFPVIVFLIWALGSGAHLYALGYVYDFGVHRELFAPTLWVLAWTLFLRLNDFIATPSPALRRAACLMPLLTTLVAAGVTGSCVFFALTLLNTVGLAVAWYRERDNRALFQTLIVSLAMPAMAWPYAFPMGPFEAAGAIAVIYLLVASIMSCDPRIGIAGAVAACFGSWGILGSNGDWWSIQIGLIFFLIHSFRWQDEEHQGAGFGRGLAAFLWVLHSSAWAHSGVAFWQPATAAFVVLAAGLFVRFVLRGRLPVTVLVAIALVALSAPANNGATRIHTISVGVVAMGISLLLFAAGTGLALLKHRWSRGGESQ